MLTSLFAVVYYSVLGVSPENWRNVCDICGKTGQIHTWKGWHRFQRRTRYSK